MAETLCFSMCMLTDQAQEAEIRSMTFFVLLEIVFEVSLMIVCILFALTCSLEGRICKAQILYI